MEELRLICQKNVLDIKTLIDGKPYNIIMKPDTLDKLMEAQKNVDKGEITPSIEYTIRQFKNSLIVSTRLMELSGRDDERVTALMNEMDKFWDSDLICTDCGQSCDPPEFGEKEMIIIECMHTLLFGEDRDLSLTFEQYTMWLWICHRAKIVEMAANFFIQ